MAESKHISIIEWLIVLCIAIFIDVAQLLTDLLTAGVMEAVWPFIDMVIGAAFALYLWYRGQKLSDPKRLGGLLATFGLEFLPLMEDLPLWSLDVVWNWFIAERKNITQKVTGNRKGLEVLKKTSSISGSGRTPEKFHKE